jgi:3-oxoadipate CoA-transferase alpha subunit
MIDKRVESIDAALAGLRDGACVMVSGFGDSGVPTALLEGLLAHGACDLTIVANNAGSGDSGLAALIREGRVRRIVCSYPRSRGSVWFETRYASRDIELEVVAQGTLSERIRAGGAGISGFFTPTGAGTELAEGKETRVIDGRECVFEQPLRADFALIKGRTADSWGNLTYRSAGRNYGPSMAMAAAITVAQVERVLPLGALDPEVIVTPGIFVQRVYERVADAAPLEGSPT